MFAQLADEGERNLATLERAVIKDNTILPGEWYGGQVHIEPGWAVAGRGGSQRDMPSSYRLVINVGGDTHEIKVQSAPTS